MDFRLAERAVNGGSGSGEDGEGLQLLDELEQFDILGTRSNFRQT